MAVGLREALEAQRPGVEGPPCGVARLLAEMDTEDAEVLRAALADRSKQGTTIARALRSVGHEVSPLIVNRHRRGDCACDRREA